ncbi:MAG: hypothetical protein JSW66_13800 [Phycisphaerales bacterium]|nr:MAG: hypothetical protein JSW66_13800 [Phycisphaerales bacterium]
MKKCVLLAGLMIVAGCSSQVAKWEDAGALVSVRPAEESTRRPGRLGTALGEEELGLTRVETTKGVYVVHGKISVAHKGMPVKVGYDKKDSSDELQDEPSYLSLGGQKHQIVH